MALKKFKKALFCLYCRKRFGKNKMTWLLNFVIYGAKYSREICGRQPLKFLLGPFLNTLSHMFSIFMLMLLVIAVNTAKCCFEAAVQYINRF